MSLEQIGTRSALNSDFNVEINQNELLCCGVLKFSLWVVLRVVFVDLELTGTGAPERGPRIKALS